jgi:hypothetical protein
MYIISFVTLYLFKYYHAHPFKIIFINHIALLLLTFGCSNNTLTIVDEGKSEYVIVLPENSGKSDSLAAIELQSHINQISGVLIPIYLDNSPLGKYEIIFGSNSHLDSIGLREQFSCFSNQEFVIHTKGNYIIISGGSDNGTLYGTYTLLEDYLGCKWFTPEVSSIPENKTIVLDKINLKKVPQIKSRKVRYKHLYDKKLAGRLKLNGNIDRNHDWISHHTFSNLVPPSEYYKSNPEYYAYRGDARLKSQLCLTNPEVFEISKEYLRIYVANNPHIKILVVGQNDNNSYCTCDNCNAIANREGSQSGVIIEFVNKLAKCFPDKFITTFAYQYSRPAPKHIIPAKNVVVTLCSIECNRSKPIATDTLSKQFRNDLEAWAKITNNIVLWDYIINFEHMVAPFPNLYLLQPNIQYFAENGITRIFEQAHGGNPIGEFGELRAWLTAKLLWDPYADTDLLIDDFLTGYYQEAAPSIKEYIELSYSKFKKSDILLDIYQNPAEHSNGFLSPEMINEYENLFEKARKKVKNKPDVLKRVEKAFLPIIYTKLEIAKKYIAGENGIYIRTKEGEWVVKQSIKQDLDLFVEECAIHNIKFIWERGLPPEKYKEIFERYYGLKVTDNLALQGKIKYNTNYSERLSAGGGRALINGIRAENNGSKHWQGFEGVDMDVVIDLGEEKYISSIEVGFRKYEFFNVRLPQYVDFFGSDDGELFTKISRIKPENEPNNPGYITNIKCKSEGSFRYVRVYAKNNQKSVDYNKPPRIDSDEIIIKK